MTTTLRRALTSATLAAAVLTMPLTGCRNKAAETTEPAADTTAAPAPAVGGTVVDVAAGDTQFSTLVELVTAAGIADQLKGAGPFTVFAPTNAAFAAVNADSLANWKKPENKARLVALLMNHVLNGNMKAADLKGMQTVTPTGSSANLSVTAEGETVKIGDATVVQADVSASNGTVHAIDKVLMPN